jgi:hypothetical protein
MNFNVWDEEGSPKIGDIVILAPRKIRIEKNPNRKLGYVSCYNFPFGLRFLGLNCFAFIVGKSEFDNKIKCVILDGDNNIYETHDDIIDLNGIRWQQHNSHCKYRLVKRKIVR